MNDQEATKSKVDQRDKFTLIFDKDLRKRLEALAQYDSQYNEDMKAVPLSAIILQACKEYADKRQGDIDFYNETMQSFRQAIKARGNNSTVNN